MLKLPLTLLLAAALLAPGCADDTDTTGTDADDALAESAPAAAGDGKADAPAGVIGFSFEMTAPASYKAGDVTNLYLLDGGKYVRGRCYHTGCSTWLAETDRYDFIKSSGKNYVRFWSFNILTDENGERTTDPVVADTYEIKKTATGIKLRKTYSSRWLTLAKRSDAALCDETGGTMESAACNCGSEKSPDGHYYGFIPGAGGCMELIYGTEDNCDSTGGLYTDDDATLIGTFCECGVGRTMTDDGCAAI